MRPTCRHLLLGLGLWLVAAAASADSGCRIAFDMGSSGIRAGSTTSRETARTSIDYLSPLLAGRGLTDTLPATVAALVELPREAGFAADCARFGGGYSAWRLALQQDPAALVATLERTHAQSGVAVLVVPQAQEGAYAYAGARKLLGDRLLTTHILDIGGGSLQIAGNDSVYGAALGQKTWHHRLCRELQRPPGLPCDLLPLSSDELARARALLAGLLDGAAAALPRSLTITAISRPVTRGVMPALARLGKETAAPASGREALARAIDTLAVLTTEEAARRSSTPPKYTAYLFSDLLLVEGLLQATGADTLRAADIDIDNLPGMLADERPYAWGAHYACYLERLRTQGIDAFSSDPRSCADGR
jgi:hypothetical protein